LLGLCIAIFSSGGPAREEGEERGDSARTESLPKQVADRSSNTSGPPASKERLRYQWQDGQQLAYTFKITAGSGGQEESFQGVSFYRFTKATNQAESLADKARKGWGTAFVVNTEGFLLTCAHVVDGASDIRVTLGGATVAAELVATDDTHDLAILRAKLDKAQPLTLADSDAVELAQEIRAVGYPLTDVLGESLKVTRGTVAGILQRPSGKAFQIDAAINPGNSGGPVVNEYGEAVAVVRAGLFGEDVASVGLGVPVNHAKPFLKRNGVQLASSRRSGKFDGPELARRMAPAVALVTVTGRPAASRIAAQYSGAVTPGSGSGSGSILPFRGRTGEPRPGTGKMLLDDLGEIHEDRGDLDLPMALGSLGSLFIETLPGEGQNTWRTKRIVPLKLQHTEETVVPAPAPRNPSPATAPSPLDRYRKPRDQPPGIRPPYDPRRDPRTQLPIPRTPAPRRISPSLPSYSQPPWARNAPEPAAPSKNTTTTVVVIPALLESRYTLGERSGDIVTISKEVTLTVLDGGDGGPAKLWSGSGKFSFNAKSGLPEAMELTVNVSDPADDRSTPLPIKIECQRKHPSDRDAPVVGATPKSPTPAPARTAAGTEVARTPEAPVSAKPEPVAQTMDVPNKHEYRRFPGTHWGVESLAFSPQGKYVAVGMMNRAVRMYDFEKSQCTKLERLESLGQVTAVAFAPDGRKLLAGGYSGLIRTWDVGPQGELNEANSFVGHAGAVRAMVVSSDGALVVSGAADRKVRCWDLPSGRERFVVEGFQDEVKACWIAPDGNQALATDGASLLRINVADGTTVGTTNFAGLHAQAVAIAPDGSKVVVQDFYALRVWDAIGGKELPRLQGTEIPWSAAFTSNGKYVFAGGSGKVSLWEVATRQKITDFAVAGAHYVNTIACTNDGLYIAACAGSSRDQLQILRLPDAFAALQQP
jgi:S1-C subfamily serine protease/WD40 repeat protein